MLEASRENALLAMALERPADARTAFLDRVCEGDPGLRQRMEDLLAAQDEPCDAGGTDVIAGSEAAVPMFQEVLLTESPGSVVGRYKLLERLGEGGFGVVWAAEQKEPVKRRVALKIIKLGMDTRQIVARFEAERQALALMDHPNIARVLDAGATQTGRPYFVMELVKGIPISAYCEQERLPISERLDLFIKICHAVQHAHQKGIIHRDIKPSNIMVTLHDGVAVPKVIDFGIAKATQAELTEKTIYTQYGQFIGTPAYMSPEQAEMSGLDIDTRSDIYSLGVLLYELLTGTTPFDTTELLESGLDEMRRIIREREPLRPSTRVRRTSSAALSGGSPPLPRHATLPADLDWIVMKCLEKDRRRRYETANALAMDLQRHLSDEPVSARPPSALYRLQKAWKRNKVAYVAGATVILALATGTIGTSLGLFRAEQEKIVAEANAAMLETSLYFSRVALAHRESTSRPANIEEAERLLDDCPARLRNWEWHYLKRRRFVEPLVINQPGCRTVHAIAFSPNNRHLAAGGSDGKVTIWDLYGPRPARVLEGHTGFVVSLAFSPTDPALIASAGSDNKDNKLRLWDWRSAREIYSWPSVTGRDYGMSSAVAFSPDGQLLAAPGEDGDVRIRYVASGRDALRLPGHVDGVHCVAFSQDGRWIATGDGRGAVCLWDGSTGRPHATISTLAPPVSGIAFLNDSHRFVAAHFDGLVRIADADPPGELSTYSVRTAGSPSVGLAVHPSGDRVVTGGLDRLVTLSEPATGRQVLVFRDLTASCYCLAFSPSGHLLAGGGRGGNVYVWDATPLDGTEDRVLAAGLVKHPGGEAWAVDLAPDGRSIAVGGYKSTTPQTASTAPVVIWRGPDDETPLRLPGYAIIVFSLAYDPTGRFLVTAGDGPVAPGTARVKVWDLQAGREAFPVEAFGGGRSYSVAFSRDGRRLVAGGTDRKIKVWDAATGRKIGVIGEHANEITSLTFSSTGRYLASIANDDVVNVWDGRDLDHPQTGPRVFAGLCGGMTDLLAFSPDESRLAIATDDDSAVIHDLEGDDRAVRLSCAGHRPVALAFSPDGLWVASGGVDCTVRLWDATSGALRRTLRSHTDQIGRLRFAPLASGTLLVSASRDGTVKLWDMNAIEKR